MAEPLVSLLIPVYNVERYLRECLDSAVGQTLRDIEIIAIDDGSTDGCPAILEEYRARDARVRVITQANAGYGAAMNAGLGAARGKYVGILESDDFFEPDALEVLCAAAEAYDVQVAKANFWKHWSAPDRRDVLYPIVTEDIAGRVLNPQVEQEPFMMHASLWSAVYRSDFLNENGIRFLETPGASFQDMSFAFKVWACATRVVFLKRAVIHYRQDNAASSFRSIKTTYSFCDEFAEVDRFLEGRPNRENLLAIRARLKLALYTSNYARLPEPQRSGFILRFSEDFRRDVELGLADFSFFEPEEKMILDLIIEDPMLFHAAYGGALNRRA